MSPERRGRQPKEDPRKSYADAVTSFNGFLASPTYASDVVREAYKGIIAAGEKVPTLTPVEFVSQMESIAGQAAEHATANGDSASATFYNGARESYEKTKQFLQKAPGSGATPPAAAMSGAKGK